MSLTWEGVVRLVAELCFVQIVTFGYYGATRNWAGWQPLGNWISQHQTLEVSALGLAAVWVLIRLLAEPYGPAVRETVKEEASAGGFEASADPQAVLLGLYSDIGEARRIRIIIEATFTAGFVAAAGATCWGIAALQSCETGWDVGT